MNASERRSVVETLLCVGMEDSDDISTVATALGAEDIILAAHCCWAEVSSHHPFAKRPLRQYEQDATEAAYRLIESSPTLRREWFGAL